MVWIDMEMTGLDFETEDIMEVACIITDKDLNIIAEADDLVLKVRCCESSEFFVICFENICLTNLVNWQCKLHRLTMRSWLICTSGVSSIMDKVV